MPLLCCEKIDVRGGNMARRGHATALTDGQWLHLSSFLPPLGLGHPLRNGQVDHVAFPSHLFSLLDKDTSLQSTLTSLKGVVQALRGDGDVGEDDARGVHETLVYLGYYVGKLLRMIRCWRAAR